MIKPDRFQVWQVPASSATREVLGLLGELITSGAAHPEIRALASSLVADVPAGAWLGEIAALWDHVVSSVRYQRDPAGVEHITDPVSLSRQALDGTAAEDCESLVAYLGALAGALGSQPALVVHARPGSDRFTHCALALADPSGRRGVYADPTAAILRGAPLGALSWPDGGKMQVWTLGGYLVYESGRQSSPGGGLVGACFGDLGQDTEAIVKGIVTQVGQVAQGFGPYGQIVAGALGLGVGIYDAATGKPLGPAVRVPAPPAGGPIKLMRPGVKGGRPAGAPGAVSPAAVAAGAGLLALLAVL